MEIYACLIVFLNPEILPSIILWVVKSLEYSSILQTVGLTQLGIKKIINESQPN